MPDFPSEQRPSRLSSQPPPHTASDAIPHVPKTLLDELHQANTDFSESRHEREAAMDAAAYSSTSRDTAHEHVIDAEKHIEAVTAKIDQILKPPSTSSKLAAKPD